MFDRAVEVDEVEHEKLKSWKVSDF